MRYVIAAYVRVGGREEGRGHVLDRLVRRGGGCVGAWMDGWLRLSDVGVVAGALAW